MILDRDATYFRQALIDLLIAAVGRKECKTDRRRIVDQLQGGLLRKQYDGRLFHRQRTTAIGILGQQTPPPANRKKYGEKVWSDEQAIARLPALLSLGSTRAKK
jgi:hypothetical protein